MANNNENKVDKAEEALTGPVEDTQETFAEAEAAEEEKQAGSSEAKKESKGTKDKPAKKDAKPVEKKPGVFARMGRSLRNMSGEMKKVVWPSKKQVLNNTAVVLGFMLVAAVVVGGFDALLSFLLGLFFGQ